MSLHSLDAEQALLGALLFDNAVFERLPALHGDQFYDPVHGRIFDECARRIRSGGLADAITLRDFFARDEALKEIGGAAYLATLLESSAKLTIHAIEYAHIIVDRASKRAIVAAAQEAIERAHESDVAAIDVLGDLEGALKGLETSTAGVSDLVEGAASFIDNMGKPSLSTGIKLLDHRWGGLSKAGLYIIGGRPSMGKTSIAAQIGRNAAQAGRVVHFASQEMSREELARRSISAATFGAKSDLDRIEYFYLKHGANIDPAKLRAIGAKLPRTFAIDDRAAQTLTQLESAARSTRRKHKRLDLIIVDYLQLMRAQRNDGRVNEISEISAGLKAIAKRLDCPVIALSQLSRNVESRENKRPTLADLRESGSIEQDADVVSFVYREAYYLERDEPADEIKALEWQRRLRECARHLEVITAKQRFGPIGTDVLEAWLEFDIIRGRAA